LFSKYICVITHPAFTASVTACKLLAVESVLKHLFGTFPHDLKLLAFRMRCLALYKRPALLHLGSRFLQLSKAAFPSAAS